MEHKSQAWTQPSGTTAILFHPRFHRGRMADSRKVFTHCALLMFLDSKLPFCNSLWIQTMWIHCCPSMHDLAHVHPNSCSSSGWHQLPDSPQRRGTGCYSTTGCTTSGICSQVTRQHASLALFCKLEVHGGNTDTLSDDEQLSCETK